MGFFRYKRIAKKRKKWEPVINDADSVSGSDGGSFVGMEVAVEKRASRFLAVPNPRKETAPKSSRSARHGRSGTPIRDGGEIHRCCPTSTGSSDEQRTGNGNQHEDQPELEFSSSSGSSVCSYTAFPPVSVADTRDAEAEFVATTDNLSYLILNLETAVVVGASEPLRALSMLLALAERQPQGHTAGRSRRSVYRTRLEMVRAENGRLVPVLLRFLNRCMFHSREHDLALLVLSKLSLPQENKELIAIDFNGAEILAKLLCEDPSCHLVALVLVNLTFDATPLEDKVNTAIEVTAQGSNSNDDAIDVVQYETDGGSNDLLDGDCDCSDGSSLRKKLLGMNEDIALVESLAFALRVSSLTQEEYDARQATIDDCNYGEEYLSPATKLSVLMAKDQQLRARKKEEEQEKEQRQEYERERERGLQKQISADEILRQLKFNEQELQVFGSIGSPPKLKEGRSRPCQQQQQQQQQQQHDPSTVLEESLHMYPETAKWCLVALRNLTKPSNQNATAAHVLIKSEIYSLIVQYVAVVAADDTKDAQHKPKVADTDLCNQIDNNFLSASYGGIHVRKIASDLFTETGAATGHNDDRISNLELLKSTNSPCLWDCNSLQDAALSVVFNLAASSQSREYMNEPSTVKVLSMIAEYPRLFGRSNRLKDSFKMEQNQVVAFQSLKARMALSYLVGSQGHFGQTKLRSSASTVQANASDSSLIMTRDDIVLFAELIADTMRHRGKQWPGACKFMLGNSCLNCVLSSLRCLLTHTVNQERIAKLIGVDLNSLLINALAQYALEPSTRCMDSESAEHAVFSLYLLSNHGLKGTPFLSQKYAPDPARSKDKDYGLAAKILFSYLSLNEITPAGQHAARQLLLRVNHLNFQKNCSLKIPSVVSPADLEIDYILLAKIERVQIADWKDGAKPESSIFHRSLLRCQKPRDWERRFPSKNSKRTKIKWDDPSTVFTFANALVAVQQLSYGSLKVHHSSPDLIDDIAIANDIARSANSERSGCYNFLWAWEDVKINASDDSDHSIILDRVSHTKCLLRLPSIGEGMCLSPLRRSPCNSDRSSIKIGSAFAKYTYDDEKISFLQLCCSTTKPSDKGTSEI